MYVVGSDCVQRAPGGIARPPLTRFLLCLKTGAIPKNEKPRMKIARCDATPLNVLVYFAPDGAVVCGV